MYKSLGIYLSFIDTAKVTQYIPILFENIFHISIISFFLMSVEYHQLRYQSRNLREGYRLLIGVEADEFSSTRIGKKINVLCCM